MRKTFSRCRAAAAAPFKVAAAMIIVLGLGVAVIGAAVLLLLASFVRGRRATPAGPHIGLLLAKLQEVKRDIVAQENASTSETHGRTAGA